MKRKISVLMILVFIISTLCSINAFAAPTYQSVLLNQNFDDANTTYFQRISDTRDSVWMGGGGDNQYFQGTRDGSNGTSMLLTPFKYAKEDGTEVQVGDPNKFVNLPEAVTNGEFTISFDICLDAEKNVDSVRSEMNLFFGSNSGDWSTVEKSFTKALRFAYVPAGDFFQAGIGDSTDRAIPKTKTWVNIKATHDFSTHKTTMIVYDGTTTWTKSMEQTFERIASLRFVGSNFSYTDTNIKKKYYIDNIKVTHNKGTELLNTATFNDEEMFSSGGQDINGKWLGGGANENFVGKVSEDDPNGLSMKLSKGYAAKFANFSEDVDKGTIRVSYDIYCKFDETVTDATVSTDYLCMRLGNASGNWSSVQNGFKNMLKFAYSSDAIFACTDETQPTNTSKYEFDANEWNHIDYEMDMDGAYRYYINGLMVKNGTLPEAFITHFNKVGSIRFDGAMSGHSFYIDNVKITNNPTKMNLVGISNLSLDVDEEANTVTINAKAKVAENGEDISLDDILFILASYEDEALKWFDHGNATEFDVATDSVVSKTFEVGTKTISTLKAFAWNNFEDLAPYCDSITK